MAALPSQRVEAKKGNVMGFGEAVKTCFSKYVVFSGRASRSEFWWFFLFTVIVQAILSLIDAQLFGVDPRTGDSRGVLSGLFQLAVFLPLLAAAWRRMHDSGRPGWYILLPMLFSFAFSVAALGGVMTFALIDARTSASDTLLALSALFGGAGLLVAIIVQLVLAVLMIVWLTRPSDPGPNAYGPA